MKYVPRLLPFVLVLAATGPVLCAQTGPGVSSVPTEQQTTPILSDHLRDEAKRLIRQDAGMLAPIPDKPEITAPPQETNDEEIVVLVPLTVTERMPPNLTPPRETRPEKFFRTGTIAEHVGRKVTTRFWFSSAKGIMLSFDF